MILDVKERLVLLGSLPREGDFTTLKILRELREALSFSDAEHKALKFVYQGSQVDWDVEAAKVTLKDFNFSGKQFDIIVESLKKLNDTKKLTLDHQSLYEKFVLQAESTLEPTKPPVPN